MSNEVQITIKTAGAQEAQTVALDLSKALQRGGEEAKSASKKFLESSREGITSLNAWLEVGQKWQAGISKAFSLVKAAADFENQANALRANVQKIGMDFDFLMATTRKASFGMVDDITLLKANSKALQMGVTQDVGKLGELWTIAKNKADLLGKSTTEVFEQMTTAIGKGQGRVLVELGLLPESFSRSANAADLLANRTRLLKETLAQGKKEIADMGGINLSTADHIERLSSSIANLKLGFRELLPAITPIVAGLVELTNVAVKAFAGLMKLATTNFSDFKADPYSKMSAGQLSNLLQQKEREITSRQLSEGVPPGVPGYRALAPGRSIELETRATRNELAEIERALKKIATKEWAAAKNAVVDFGATWKDIFGNIIPTFSDKAEKSTAKIKKEVDELGKAFREIEKDSINAFQQQLGSKFVPTIQNASVALWDAASAAVGFGRGLKDGLTQAGLAEKAVADLDQRIRTATVGKQFTLESATPEEATKGFLDMFGFGQAMRGELKKVDVAKEIKSEKNEVAKAFSDALLQGVRSGNYLDALKQGLRSAVAESFQQRFPIFNQAGQFSLGNFGVNMAAGYVSNKLFGAGGLFGDRVVHGQEAISNSASINDQVKQAMASRDQMLVSAIGVSSETIRRLQEIEFALTSTVANKSGDGIFSKKTTTYDIVGGAAAGNSLEAFKKAAEKATNEAALREFNIAMTEISDPLQALKMRMADLAEAIARLGKDTLTAKPYVLELARAEQELADRRRAEISRELQRNAGYSSMLLSNPYAGRAIARENIDYGFFGMGKASDYLDNRLNGKLPAQGVAFNGVSMADFMNGIDARLFAQSGVERASGEFWFQKRLGDAGTDLSQVNALLSERAGFLTESLADIEKVITTSLRKATSSKSLEEQTTYWKTYEESVVALFDTKKKVLDIEATIRDNQTKINEEAAAKAEAEAEALRRQAEEAEREAENQRRKRMSDASIWLNFAAANAGVLGDITQAEFLRSKYASAQVGTAGMDIGRQIAIMEQNSRAALEARSGQLAARNDPAAIAAMWNRQLSQSRSEETFFQDLLDRTKAMALDASIGLEEQAAALERINQLNDKVLSAKLKSLEIEAEMNEEVLAERERIKAQRERITQDALANLSIAIGELATTSRGTEVLILSGESRSAKIRDISRILMDSGAGITPEVKAALDALVNSAEVNGSYEASFRL